MLERISEREGLHESFALEMGASLSGEGGVTGGEGAPQAVGGRWRANPLAPGPTRRGRKAQRLLVVGDGEFSVAGLRASLPEDVVLFGRCARNLYALPENGEGKRGRKRKYGQKARKPHEWLAERHGWRRAEFNERRSHPTTG